MNGDIITEINRKEETGLQALGRRTGNHEFSIREVKLETLIEHPMFDYFLVYTTLEFRRRVKVKSTHWEVIKVREYLEN